MRRGSVAIVPLLLAIMLFFWFIWFLGGESDTLHEINNVEHLHHIQEELVISAMQEKIRLEQNQSVSNLTDSQIDDAVNGYVDQMMLNNQIHTQGGQ